MTDTLTKKGKTVVPPVPLPRRIRNTPRVVHSILKSGKSDAKIHKKSFLQSIPDGILHFEFKPSDDDSKKASVCSDPRNRLLPKTCTDIKCTCYRQSDTMPLLKMAIGYSAEGSHETSDKVVVLASCINQYMEAVFLQIDTDNTGYVSKREFDALAKCISIPRRKSWGASKGKISFSEFQSRLWDCWFQNNKANIAAMNNRRPNPSLLESILKCTRSLKSLEDLSRSLNNFNKVVQNNVNLLNESSNVADNSQVCPFTADSAEILDLKRNYFVHCEENKRLRRAVEDLRNALQNSDAENLALRVKMQVREEIRAEISQTCNNGNKGKHFQHCVGCFSFSGENKSEPHNRTTIIRSSSEPRLSTATDMKSDVLKVIRSAPTSPQWKRRRNYNDELWADFQRGLDSSFETSSAAEPTESNSEETEQPSKTDNICIKNGKPQFEIPKFKSQDSNPVSLKNCTSKITSSKANHFGLPLFVTPTSTISQYENTCVTSDLLSSRGSYMNVAHSSTNVDLNDTYVSMCSTPKQISVEEHIYNEINDNLPKFSKKENPLPLKSAVSVPCMSSIPKPKIEFVRSQNLLDVKVAQSRPVEKEVKRFCNNESLSALYANTAPHMGENPCYQNISNLTGRTDTTELYATVQPKSKRLQENKNVEQDCNALYQNVNAEGCSKFRSLSQLCQNQISNPAEEKCTLAAHTSRRSLIDLSHTGNRKESITSPMNGPIRLRPASAVNIAWTFNNPTYDSIALESRSGLVEPVKFVSPTQHCDVKVLAKTPRISPSIQGEASPRCNRSSDLAGLLATRDLLLATLQAVTAVDRNSNISSSTAITNDNIENSTSSDGSSTTTHNTTHHTAQHSRQHAEHMQAKDACTGKTAEHEPSSGHNGSKRHPEWIVCCKDDAQEALTCCVNGKIKTDDLQRGEAEGSEEKNVAEEEAKDREKEGCHPVEDEASEVIITREVEGQEEEKHGNNETKINSAEAIFDEFLEYCRHYDVPLEAERQFERDKNISNNDAAEETMEMRKHDSCNVSSGRNPSNISSGSLLISAGHDPTLKSVLLSKCPWCSPSMDSGEFCNHVPPLDDDCSSAEGAGSDSGKGDSLGSSPSPERLSQTSTDGSEDGSWESAECPLEEPLLLPRGSSAYHCPPSFEEGETEALVSLLEDYDHVEGIVAQETIVEASLKGENIKVDDAIQEIDDIKHAVDINRDIVKQSQFEEIKSNLIDENYKEKVANSDIDNLKVKSFFGRRSRSFNTFKSILASTTSHFKRNSKSRSSISSCNPSFSNSNSNYIEKTEQHLAPSEIKSIFKNNESKKPFGSKIKRHISFSDKVDVYDASDEIVTYNEDLEDEHFCQDAVFVLDEEGSCLQEEQTQDVYSESATRELENIFDEAVAYLAENDEIEDVCNFKNQSYLWCTEDVKQFEVTAAAAESFYDMNTSNVERNSFPITEHVTTLQAVVDAKSSKEFFKQVTNLPAADHINNYKSTALSKENVVQASSNRDLLDALDEELQLVLQQLEDEDNWLLQGN